MTKLRAPLLAALVMFPLSACSVMDDKAAGDRAIQAFHDRYDQEDFALIYATTDAAFRGETSETQLTSALASMRARMGAVKSSETTHMSFNYDTRGDFLTLTCKTEFSAGSATEEFRFRIVGKEARLIGYNIQLPKQLDPQI